MPRMLPNLGNASRKVSAYTVFWPLQLSAEGSRRTLSC